MAGNSGLRQQQHPPTPPASSDGDPNFPHLNPYQGGMQAYPSYSTPPPNSMYGDPAYYQTPQHQYLSPDYQQQPRLVRDPYDPIHSRNGGYLGSPIVPGESHPDRRSKSPKPKKTRKPAAKASKATPIKGPLSEITKDYPVAVKDMGEWVNRSAEVRRKEAEKKGGYVARPMNSFMLYRSAYAERIKMYCRENNHQVVSQVSGASWPLEPKDVRDLYEHYATVERENHQKAHPDYKFAPNKNAANKKRKSWESDEESEADDPEWRSGRSASSKRIRSERTSARSTPFESKPLSHPLAHLHPSSWEANNIGRPIPHSAPMSDMPAQYYQHPVTPYMHRVEDAAMRKAPQHLQQHGPGRVGTPLLGMPGGSHQDLLQPHSQISTPIPGETHMDPALLYDTGNPNYSPFEEYPQSNYQYGSTSGVTTAEYPQYTSGPQYHPGLQTLTDGRDAWNPGLGAGSEFDAELNKYY